MSSISSSKADENDTQIENKPNRAVVRVGSRKSELALVQTNHVITLLKKLYPNHTFEIYEMTTVGDRVLNISLPKIGEKSLFTKDLEEALKNEVVDFVVHSLKDLPTTLPDNMTIGAVLEREDPRDALVLAKHHEGKCLKTLPAGSIIGTSSLRRIAQILRSNTHLKVQDIRGNLNTRLAKLDAVDSKYAGIVLAHAGLARLGWHQRINQTIEPSEMLYAVGQGALAVECRSSDQYILEMLQTLVCHHTQCRILAERSFLKTLGGGCSAPVAVHSTLAKTDTSDSNKFKLNIIGSVWSLDGKTEKQAECACDLELSEETDIAVEHQSLDEDAVQTKRMRMTQDELKIDHISHPVIIDQMKHDFKKFDETNQNSQISEIDSKDVQSATLKNSSFPISAGMKDKLSHLGSSSSKCPLNFSVGQEVMGQCPFGGDTNEVLFKPSTQDTSLDIKNKSGCPFGYKSSLPATDIVKCPVYKKSEIDSDTTNRIEKENLDTIGSVEQLFCGLYPHSRWPLKVFEQCEQLGKILANKLIEKGAISIMESAQNEIRNNM